MGLSKSNPPNAKVKLLVSPTSGRIPWTLLSWLALGSGAAVLVSIILSGAKLIVDPYSPNWLKTAFPGLINSFEAMPQTVDEIEADMRSQGISAGKPIVWPTSDHPKAWFYPILNSDNRTIQALWVYRVRGDQLQRIDQVTIRPMKESFITTPLVGTASQVASIDSDAPLSSVQLMPGQSANQPWLLLEGQHRYGNIVMRYGQILSYQESSHRLHRLLNWSSSSDKPPQWQRDQLIINQTVGLRPSFLLYQLVPNDPPRLQEISLYRSVYESDLSTSLYDKALQLAQGAVWSHSIQMMESAKMALGQDWTSDAQTQLDLIRLHAKVTKAQTEQTWSSQQQHILTYLIDGQWDKAFKELENQPAIYDSTLKRLERDFDALWRGVTTHLQVHPKDMATQLWGALLVTSRQSQEAGEDWLKSKTRSKTTLERLRTLGKKESTSNNELINDNTVDGSTSTPPLPTAVEAGRYQGLVGQATAIGAPGAGWVRSQTLPTLAPGQTWYRIQVQLIQDNSGWGLPPEFTTASAFWSESLALRRQLQLFRGSTPISGITIHGVQGTGSHITLLAVGPEIDGRGLVIAGNSLRWLTTLPWQTIANTPDSLNHELGSELEDLSQTNRAASAANESNTLITTAIGRHLNLVPEQTTQLYPHLQYAKLDLVGDTETEHIVTIGPGVPSELGLIPGKTMILSDIGNLIYSDINQQQSLVALTEKSNEQSAILLVKQGHHYDLIGL